MRRLGALWAWLRRPRRKQLRTRVLVSVFSVTLVALAAFDYAGVTALRAYLIGETDGTLQTIVNASLGPRLEQQILYAEQHKLKGLPRVLVRANGPYPVGGYWVGFFPSRGGSITLARTGNEGPPPVFRRATRTTAGPQPIGPVTVTKPGASFGFRVQQVNVDNGQLVASTSLVGVDQTVGHLIWIVVLGSIAIAILMAIGLALILRRGLRPIESMATEADRISAGDLTDRVEVPDELSEVGRLGVALNGMLGRIEATVQERETDQEAVRRFFADASHELRTPLASLRANAELYQQGALTEKADVDEAMRRISLEAQRMSRLVDDMLRLARLDQHPEQHHDLIDLSAIADECLERARVAYPDRAWTGQVGRRLATVGDVELVRRAIDNLLVNVTTHTPEGTNATLAAGLSDDGSTVSISVSDEGPGVGEERLPYIFDRFYRAGGQPARPGSGLGLAIVAAVATTHQGRVDASSNEPHGLAVTLTLPAWHDPVGEAAEPLEIVVAQALA